MKRTSKVLTKVLVHRKHPNVHIYLVITHTIWDFWLRTQTLKGMLNPALPTAFQFSIKLNFIKMNIYLAEITILLLGEALSGFFPSFCHNCQLFVLTFLFLSITEKLWESKMIPFENRVGPFKLRSHDIGNLRSSYRIVYIEARLGKDEKSEIRKG